MLRRTVPLLLLALLPACDDDPVSPRQPRLETSDVQAIYAVCDLRFDPTGSLLPVVDIRAEAFRPSEGPVREPRLAINPDGELAFTFTPSGENIERTLSGQIASLGTSDVTIQFTAGDFPPSTVLLPVDLRLTFQESPKTLHVAESNEFNVPKAAYEALVGPDDNIADPVEGTLTATFVENACP